MEVGENETDKYEQLLDDYSKLFHENHFQVWCYLSLKVEILLCLLFQILLLKKYLAESIKGSITLDQIRRKLNLMKDYLKTFEIIDEGLTK